MSVYTGGNVNAVGDITSTTGNIVATAGNIVITAGSLNVGTRIAGTSSGTAFVLGVCALTVAGVTTSSLAFVIPVTQGSLSVNYKAVCTANTITISALVAAGTVNTADTTSVVNYFVVN
jgi:hypothetical protein